MIISSLDTIPNVMGSKFDSWLLSYLYLTEDAVATIIERYGHTLSIEILFRNIIRV